jgi:selenocysteine-specific elongation factor
MLSIVVGTAGHIDHGKTTLVRALTGIDADRLPEEKRRGITIDLGFADLDLGDVRVGFVDVPGHEKFVKNMLAGAHGIDAVLLVIAADEGVMPQTREHFDICRLLNVRTGLIVITKTDTVDEELLELVRAEAEDLVANSFLEGVPVLNVSAQTGLGLDLLKESLRTIARTSPARLSDTVTRLPIDRAFSIRGFGAVVTGTLVSGRIAEGDEMEILPLGQRVRVRGVQVHGAPVGHAVAGQRTAINLGGIDVATAERGMILAPVGYLQATQIVDVKLDVLKSAAKSVRSRSRVRVHLGAAETLARIRVFEEAGEIPAGASGFAQLRFESPIVTLPGERFIVRSYSPSRTVAGGEVLDPIATKYRGRELPSARSRLNGLTQADRSARFGLMVETTREQGLRNDQAIARTGWWPEVLRDVAAEAVGKGAIIEANEVYIGRATFDRLSRAALEAVREHHSREPLSRGISRETLRERHFAHAAPEIFRAVIAHLEAGNQLVAEREVIRARSHSLSLLPADVALNGRLEAVYKDAGLEAPTIEDAMLRAGVTVNERERGRKLLQLLIDGRVIVRVSGDLLFHREALSGLITKLREHAARGEQRRTVDVATFKDLAGVSRKYAIPLLEYLDREHVTRRAGDRRMIL